MNNTSKFKFYILNKATLQSKSIEKVYIYAIYAWTSNRELFFN